MAKLKKNVSHNLNYIKNFRKFVKTLDSYGAIESNITLDEFVNSPLQYKDNVEIINDNDVEQQQPQQQQKQQQKQQQEQQQIAT